MTLYKKMCRATNYQQADRKTIQFLVIHYTGNLGDTAAANAAYFAREDVKASAHYFIDETEIWQSVPDKAIAWHCGCSTGYYHALCRNANSIGVEVCMLDRHGNIRYGSIQRAAEQVRYLMARYGIQATQIIRHYDVTHKECPAPMVQDTKLWKAFQSMIQQENLDIQEKQMTQQEFDSMMNNWLERKDPTYQNIGSIPAYLQREAQELAEANALRGDEKGLNVQHSQLRTMIVAKRYADHCQA